MLRLKQASNNTVSDTLTDHLLGTGGQYYLLVFTPQGENSKKALVITPTTVNDRSVIFDLDLRSSGNIELVTGRHVYTAYLQSSADNTDPDDASVIGVIKKDLAIVHQDDASVVYSETETTDVTYTGT